MTTPDHVENTGDNLRHAAEVQQQAESESETNTLPDETAPETPLPDFNT